MNIYHFSEKVWPYIAIICAKDENEAIDLYILQVCDPDDENVELHPVEVSRAEALELMTDGIGKMWFKSKEEDIDNALLSGVASVVAIDSALF